MNKQLNIKMIIFSFIIMLISSCTNHTAPSDKEYLRESLIFGEISLLLNGNIIDDIMLPIDENTINEFLESYAIYEPKIIKIQANARITISFNYHFISGNKLVEIMNHDPKIAWATLNPAWYPGEIVVKLNENLNNESLSIILDAFSEWELKLLSQAKSIDYYRFSFNHKKIDEFEIRALFENNSLIEWADFYGPYRRWNTGRLIVTFDYFVSEYDLTDFISSYSEWDLKIDVNWFEATKMILFRFNHMLIDEFEFLDIMNNDHRVRRASFNYIFGITGG